MEEGRFRPRWVASFSRERRGDGGRATPDLDSREEGVVSDGGEGR
jgi:hypothetical protein